MGAVLDTTVLIELERASRLQQPADPGALIGERLLRCLGPDEEAGIAAITASELLHGVHRAGVERRPAREAFVEAILAVLPVLEFDLLAARAHARLWADLAITRAEVRPHDRLVAATAISVGWRVATARLQHFESIAGLQLVEVR